MIVEVEVLKCRMVIIDYKKSIILIIPKIALNDSVLHATMPNQIWI